VTKSDKDRDLLCIRAQDQEVPDRDQDQKIPRLKRPKIKKTQVEKDPSLKRPSKEKDLLWRYLEDTFQVE
jgi:hypothetical protein